MKLNPIALAIPFFFALIGLEVWLARRRKLPLYRFHDAVSDLSCGVTNQLAAIVWGAALLSAYAFFYDRFRVATLPTWAAWVVATVGIDFAYYWWHRLSHEVNFLWAAHVVHHSSEDYNLAVALRQSAFTSITIWPFYLPLAFLGVPPLIFGASAALSLLYQFWIHTELIGPTRLDRFINTPSVHRVHHAINPRYLDKNYAATFMIWDRMFGTFEPEVERPVYGISVPLQSFNPLWAQVHHYAQLLTAALRAPSLSSGLAVFWKSPAYQPSWMEPKTSCFRPEGIEKYDVQTSDRLRAYVFVNFTIVVVLVFSILMWGSQAPRGALLAACAFAFVTLVSLSGLTEGKRWALPVEIARFAAGVSAAAVLLP